MAGEEAAREEEGGAGAGAKRFQIAIPSSLDVQKKQQSLAKKRTILFQPTSTSSSPPPAAIATTSPASTSPATASVSASASPASAPSSASTTFASPSPASFRNPALPPLPPPASSSSTPARSPANASTSALNQSSFVEGTPYTPAPFAPFTRRPAAAIVSASPSPISPITNPASSSSPITSPPGLVTSTPSRSPSTPGPPTGARAPASADPFSPGSGGGAPYQARGGMHQIVVNKNQERNPVLKHVRNVPYTIGEIEADYQIGRNNFALFLSFKYHRLHPNYIYARMKPLANSGNLRVLMALVDVEDPQGTLTEITKICLMNGYTLFLSWSPEECGRYLETFKTYENKGPDMIKARTSKDYIPQLTDCLTCVRSVNKTDVVTLASTFGSLKRISEASVGELSLCPGFGTSKAQRLYEAFNQPFHPNKKQKPS